MADDAATLPDGVPIPTLLGGQYRRGARIGHGGMALVFEGRDITLRRPVAIKVFALSARNQAADPGDVERAVRRFRDEAAALASLNHPAVVQVYNAGEEPVTRPDGTAAVVLWIVMELVEGEPLSARVGRQRPLPLDEAVRITVEVLTALEQAHEKKIVHRDVKPANIMVAPSGAVKVMDFGIARVLSDTATMSMTVIGTPAYMSPEQASGDETDVRSDLYSTGCVLFELLTGRPPFVADTPVAVAAQHVLNPSPLPSQLNPDIPPELDQIVTTALAKHPADRYEDAAEFRAALQAVSRTVRSSPVDSSSDSGARVVAPASEPTVAEAPPSPTRPYFEVSPTLPAPPHLVPAPRGSDDPAEPSDHRTGRDDPEPKIPAESPAEPDRAATTTSLRLRSSAASIGRELPIDEWTQARLHAEDPSILESDYTSAALLVRSGETAWARTLFRQLSSTAYYTADLDRNVRAYRLLCEILDSQWDALGPDDPDTLETERLINRLHNRGMETTVDDAVNSLPRYRHIRTAFERGDPSALNLFREVYHKEPEWDVSKGPVHAVPWNVRPEFRPGRLDGLVNYQARAPSTAREVALGCVRIILGDDRVRLSGIDWRVLHLDRPGSRALLLADRVIGTGPYHQGQTAVTWERCDLRRWLNGPFLGSLGEALTSRVKRSPVSSGPDGGKYTEDQVFLLSTEEVAWYLALDQRVDFEEERFVARDEEDRRAKWWLRSPARLIRLSGRQSGTSTLSALYVDINGSVFSVGAAVSVSSGGVRPALWLDLESESWDGS